MFQEKSSPFIPPQQPTPFKIKIQTGKVITKVSFFPQEGEVLLWPGQKYIVTKPVSEEEAAKLVRSCHFTNN